MLLAVDVGKTQTVLGLYDGKTLSEHWRIATEAQRQLHENFSLFIRSFLPRYPQPEADAIENLSMAVIVDQKRLGVEDVAAALAYLARQVWRYQPAPGTATSEPSPTAPKLDDRM